MRPSLVALPFAALAAAVATVADHARWSALLLHAEPLVLLAAALGAYLSWSARQRAVAVGLVAGAAIAFVLVRIPGEAQGPMGGAPSWARQIQGCAMALDAPRADVDVLQWTLSGPEASAGIAHAVEVIGPDLLVVHNLDDDRVLADLVEQVGGEYQFSPPTDAGPGFGMYTRGSFSLCDGQDSWSDGLDGPGGYRYAFVGLGDAATFPLVVTRFPGPLTGGDWAAAMGESGERLEALLDTLRSPLTVVVADAPVTSTYRHLYAELGGLGLVPVPTPPNFPARLGGFPLLPLHAYDRAWTGRGWSTLVSKRVAVDQGMRTPIWTRLQPVERASARR